MTTMMPTNPNQKLPELPDLNYRILDRELDRVKSRVFMGKTASFLAPLMCSMNFSWSLDIKTAATDGINLLWNPYFFLHIKPKCRPTVLVHELWHPGLLHMLRRGSRDPYIWNIAGDIQINNMLDHEGYCFEELNPWMDHSYDKCTTEEIYDDLIQKRDEEIKQLFSELIWNYKDPNGEGDKGDIQEELSPEDQKKIEHAIINNVVSAANQAEASGCGDLPGDIKSTIKKFLAPKLPWDQILYQFFNALDNQDYSWRRPNRRYDDMYLPSMMEDHQGLEHILYFEDVSGSISDTDSIRFNSELKYVKDTFQPEKMTVCQFDTIIQKEDVLHKDDPFEEFHILGGGGTSLVPVRNKIIKENPTAVVIFSDLQCGAMEPLPSGINPPIIWIALNNTGATVPHGQIVHLRE